MKKTTSITAVILFLFVCFLSASAEDYLFFTELTDPFFKDGKEPWDYHLPDVTIIENSLEFFECKDKRMLYRFRYVCVSDDSKYSGRYKLTLDFNTEGNSALQAIEIEAYHPAIKWDWDNYGNIDSALKKITANLKAKSYVKGNINKFNGIKTERNNFFGIQDIVHTLLDKNADVTDTFWFDKTGITVGHDKDTVVINLASFDYYNKNYYFEEYITMFGDYKTFFPLTITQ